MRGRPGGGTELRWVAKEMTREQASTAIDVLNSVIGAAIEAHIEDAQEGPVEATQEELQP